MTSLRSAALMLLVAASVASLACGSSAPAPKDGSAPDGAAPDTAAPDAGATDTAAPDAATAIAATPGAWTWIDVPGTSCDEGTPTGIAVNPSPDPSSGELFIYFMGGGACWDASTCFVLNTSVHGPFGSAQWPSVGLPIVAHALDRTRATNPFRNASYVFVPYCTGDLHAGSNVATYDLLGPHLFRHVGRLNVEADVPRIQATWPAATNVVVAGSSAGGFGATLNYDLIRRTYPSATVSLIDDAGPFLEGSDIPPDERGSWNASWHLGDIITPICAGCLDDVSLFYPALAALYPADRMALLSSLQDQTIRTYFLITLGADYEAKLRKMITDRIDPIPTFHTFLIGGESHTLMGSLDTTMAGGLTLEAWLGQMITGASAWTSVGP